MRPNLENWHEHVRLTGDWQSGWIGQDWWHRYWDGDPADAEDSINAIAGVFDPEWLVSQIGLAGEQHPFAVFLTHLLPHYVRDLTGLGANLRRFAAAKRFPTIVSQLRDAQDFPHARCCLEVASILSGAGSLEVEFERPRNGDPDNGACDVFVEGACGTNAVFVEVKVQRLSLFDKSVRALMNALTTPSVEGISGCEVTILQQTVSDYAGGRLDLESFCRETFSAARALPIGKIVQNDRVVITRKGGRWWLRSRWSWVCPGSAREERHAAQRLVGRGVQADPTRVALGDCL